MSDLLFLPAPGHHDALLGDGVGGARVPKVRRAWRDAPVPPDGYIGSVVSWVWTGGRGDALILIWHGQVAQEGCDRLARAIGEPPDLIFHRWDTERAKALAAHAERAGLGTVRVGGDRV